MNLSLLVLAAGMGSRYGGLKQVESVGAHGEMLIDYAIFDAIRAGFNRVVFVIRHDFETEFRERIGNRYKGRIVVDYAFQNADDLPAGFKVPEQRSKPWGTAHAVRAARTVVNEPFVMINADDFYGKDAYQEMAQFLSNEKKINSAADKMARFGMVGYRLSNTLSEHGSVARGICSVDSADMLKSVTEMTKIVARPDGGAENKDDGTNTVLSGAERVSMNFWGFTPKLFDLLENSFPVWLDENGADLKKEWYISQVISEFVCDKLATVKVLHSDSHWFGMTYREDKPRVMQALSDLSSAGVYPSPLFG